MWKGVCGMPQRTLEIIIPVYRPGSQLSELLTRLEKQNYPADRIHLMHTISGEPLPPFPEMRTPVEIHPLTREEFDHGATRDLAVSFCQSDIVMFMTQDAMPADRDLTAVLMESFDDEKCAAAYARQLPRKEHGRIETFTRVFNYPGEDRVQSLETLPEYGIKTYFCSDACAAYRRDLYHELGGFEKPCIFNEDMLFCHRLVQAGYSIRYRSQARVLHSHRYTGKQQFRRNFDLGVSQAQHEEIFASVSSTSEGKRLVRRTAQFLARGGHFLSVAYLIYFSGMKWLGYKAGRSYRKLPSSLVRRFTMNRAYWDRIETDEKQCTL